jgi:tetratricopeptide (TPR) repeat protein
LIILFSVCGLNSYEAMEYEREESMGYILPEQALLQVGQTLLKAGVQVVMSGVMNGFGGADALNETATKIAGDTGKSITDVLANMDPLEKFGLGGLMGMAGENGIAKGLFSVANQGVSNVLNGLIQGTEITLDDDGNFEGFRFNGRTFENMTVGEGALGGYLSSFVGTASTQMFQDLLPKVDLGDFAIDLRMDTSKINVLGSTLGGLMGEMASVLADGEFTINLLNLSDLMILGGMKTGEAQKYSMGLFEFGIGLNDEGKMVSRSRFGTGGAKLNLASNWGVWDQIGSVLNVNRDVQEAEKALQSIRDGGPNNFDGDSEVSIDLIEMLAAEEDRLRPQVSSSFVTPGPSVESSSTTSEGLTQTIGEEGNEEELTVEERIQNRIDEYLEKYKQFAEVADKFMETEDGESYFEGLDVFDSREFVEEMVRSGNEDMIEGALMAMSDLETQFRQMVLLGPNGTERNQIKEYTAVLEMLEESGILDNAFAYNPFVNPDFEARERAVQTVFDTVEETNPDGSTEIKHYAKDEYQPVVSLNGIQFVLDSQDNSVVVLGEIGIDGNILWGNDSESYGGRYKNPNNPVTMVEEILSIQLLEHAMDNSVTGVSTHKDLQGIHYNKLGVNSELYSANELLKQRMSEYETATSNFMDHQLPGDVIDDSWILDIDILEVQRVQSALEEVQRAEIALKEAQRELIPHLYAALYHDQTLLKGAGIEVMAYTYCNVNGSIHCESYGATNIWRPGEINGEVQEWQGAGAIYNNFKSGFYNHEDLVSRNGGQYMSVIPEYASVWAEWGNLGFVATPSENGLPGHVAPIIGYGPSTFNGSGYIEGNIMANMRLSNIGGINGHNLSFPVAFDLPPERGDAIFSIWVFNERRLR